MGDEKLRRLERRWKSTGAAADEEAYLRERGRSGDQSEGRRRFEDALLADEEDPARYEALATWFANSGDELRAAVLVTGLAAAEDAASSKEERAARQAQLEFLRACHPALAGTRKYIRWEWGLASKVTVPRPSDPNWAAVLAFLADPLAIIPAAALSSLDLDGASLEDFTPLANLTRLTELDLTSTAIEDLAPLAGLVKLRKLTLEDTQVSDLTPLAGLVELQYLDLSETPVHDLGPLRGLASLRELCIATTSVRDLAPLAELTGLWDLSAYETPICDLSPLAGLRELDRLNLANTEVADLSPLAGLVLLEELNIEETQVRDLTPIAELPALERLRHDKKRMPLPPSLEAAASLSGLYTSRTRRYD